MKKFKLPFLILLILAVFLAVFFLFFNKEKDQGTEIIKADPAKESESFRPSSIPVKVAKVLKGDLPLRLKISGSAQAREKAVIKSEVSGKIFKIYVNPGDKVKKGEILIKIDDTEKKLELEKAEANKLKSLAQYLIDSEFDDLIKSKHRAPDNAEKFKKIKDEYLKAISDLNSGKITQSEFDRISEKYESIMVSSGSLRQEIKKANDGLADAIISVKQARLNLSRTIIRSPFNGVVSELKVSRGENINTGQELLKVVNLNSVYIEGYALESEVKNLNVNTKVRIKLDSYNDRYFYGSIDSISPEIDSTNKTISVFVKISNSDNKILPGMHAEMDIEYKIFKDIYKVPLKAIIVRQDRPLIFVVNGKTVNWVYVDLGPKNDDEQGVAKFYSEVKEGDLVVIEGHATLAHQSRVKIVE